MSAWSDTFVENNDSAEKGSGALCCEGALAVVTTGGGKGAAKSGAGNDEGGTEGSDTAGGPVPIVGVGPLDEAEGEGGVGRDREEELLFTLEPLGTVAGECDVAAPEEEEDTPPTACAPAAEEDIVGGQPGGPTAGKLLLALVLQLVVVVLLLLPPACSEGLG